ncbi:MAG: Asp-tRNA(Asn)/Glu-tRNA(Gln) amidotransferase subunit GatB [Phycisphaerae bacterium]|nr:Asp-tRNA(Asn)/Glu-tRNA(Gln) amidotransferase subunit GatB [Phycisphaerae bacterium]
MKSELIVGLEIHIQLATKSKLFCGCKIGYGDDANSNVCPVCLGLPGALPVMNRKAYELSVKAALALNLKIANFTKWDRKCYYYPDLPKNYQISQYDLPMSYDGYIDIPLEDGNTKRIGLIRAHLEEDAGKNQHEGLSYSRVDLNRTGTALLEIVTEPDIESAEQCRILCQQLQKIIQFLGVSDANMQLGQMRFEPNINLKITDDDGKVYKTPICEIKNLNSFRAVEGAVAYEQWRQLEEWKKDKTFTIEHRGKQNRGWDDEKQQTVFQREKEESHDYRYFPDPDLVPVEVDQEWLAELRASMPEMPGAMKKRFIEKLGLNDYDASVLTADAATAKFFDAAVKAGGSAKRVANLVTQLGLSIANESNTTVDQIGISANQLGQLAAMIDGNKINASAGAKIFKILLEDDRDPETIAKENNLIQVSDTSAIESIVDQVLADNPAAVEEALSGSKKAGKSRGFLMGQVMQKSKGQANPQVVNKLLDDKLK